MKSIRHAVRAYVGRLFPADVIIALTCAIAIVLLWGAVKTQARFDRQQTIEAAIKQNSLLAIAFEQYTIRTIDGADAITQVLKHEYVRSGRRLDLDKLIAEHVIDPDLFTAVSIIDEHGDVVLTSYRYPPGTRPVNIADREHFKVHIPGDTGRVFVGKPVISRTFRRPSIAITRRINKPGGGFGGVVAVLMEPQHFIRFLGDRVLNPNDVVSLVGRDGITRARRTGPLESSGEDLHETLWYTKQASNPVGNYFSPGKSEEPPTSPPAVRNYFNAGRPDGIPRFYSFRRVRNQPLVTSIGVSETDVLEKFWQREQRYYSVACLITALIVTFGGLMLSVRVRKRRMMALLLDSEKRLKALFDHSSDGILLADNEARYLDANAAACLLLGYTREEILQRLQWDMTPEADARAARNQWSQFLATGRQSGEYQIQRSDGSIVEIEYSAVANIEPGVHLSIFRDVTARNAAEEQVRRLGEQHLKQQRLLTHRIITTLEEERRAISFELHDGLTQYVMSSFAFLDSYAASLGPSSATLSVDLQKALKYLHEAVIEARRMVNGLRSLALDELGLVGALEQLLQEERERSDWADATLVAVAPIPRFDTTLETAAYRVVQEALTNVRKHAEATRVTVRLEVRNASADDGGCLVVEVRDWGKGFTVEEKREASAHVGLHSMEERVHVLHGGILIQSRPGEGTCVVAEFPIAPGRTT
jgi:PAS domain S-box-containing protein